MRCVSCRIRETRGRGRQRMTHTTVVTVNLLHRRAARASHFRLIEGETGNNNNPASQISEPADKVRTTPLPPLPTPPLAVTSTGRKRRGPVRAKKTSQEKTAANSESTGGGGFQSVEMDAFFLFGNRLKRYRIGLRKVAPAR